MFVLIKQLGGDDIKRLEDIEYEDRTPADYENTDYHQQHGDYLKSRISKT